MEEELIKTIERVGKKLNEEYLRATTKSKQRRIIYDLYSYDSFCNQIVNIENPHLWIVDENLLPEDSFLEIINRDKKIFFDISKTVINTFIDEKFPIYKNYYKKLPKINEKEMQDIIKSFFSSIDEDVYKKFKNKSNEYRLLETEYYMEEEGFTLPLEIINDSFITVKKYNGYYDLSFAVTLVHELGHQYELEHLYNQNRLGFKTKSMLTPYYEVSSKFFEYAFLRYLKDNKILEHSTKLSMQEYYQDLYIYNFYMNVISMKSKITTSYGNVYVDEENIKKYADYIMQKYNFYETSVYNMGLDCRCSYIYPIGGIFAIYMYEEYQKDKNKFIAELKKTFLEYPNNPSIEVFKNVGVTYDKLKEGKILKKVIKE